MKVAATILLLFTVYFGTSQKVYHKSYAIYTSGGKVYSKSELELYPDSTFSFLYYNIERFSNVNYDSSKYYGSWSVKGKLYLLTSDLGNQRWMRKKGTKIYYWDPERKRKFRRSAFHLIS